MQKNDYGGSSLETDRGSSAANLIYGLVFAFLIFLILLGALSK